MDKMNHNQFLHLSNLEYVKDQDILAKLSNLYENFVLITLCNRTHEVRGNCCICCTVAG